MDFKKDELISSVPDIVGIVAGAYSDFDNVVITFLTENKSRDGKSNNSPLPQIFGEMLTAMWLNSETYQADLYYMVLLQTVGTSLNVYSLVASKDFMTSVRNKEQPKQKCRLYKFKNKWAIPDAAGSLHQRKTFFSVLCRVLAWVNKMAGKKDFYVDQNV